MDQFEEKTFGPIAVRRSHANNQGSVAFLFHHTSPDPAKRASILLDPADLGRMIVHLTELYAAMKAPKKDEHVPTGGGKPKLPVKDPAGRELVQKVRVRTRSKP